MEGYYRRKQELPKQLSYRPELGENIIAAVEKFFPKRLMVGEYRNIKGTLPGVHLAAIGDWFGQYAAEFESFHGKPGAGLFLIREAGSGRKIDEIEKGIVGGKFDEEMKKWAAKHEKVFSTK
ncbi:MAG: hypothetical protein NTY90_02640 [Candidatus Micrarchaeota archaeon]|nr:hypothetical protein [Candidatus Micrarchaeota archaeon]